MTPLSELPAQELKRLIRLCHPNEHGEPYRRDEVIHEITRRGISLLKELGYGITSDSVMQNCHTGEKEPIGSFCDRWRIGLGKQCTFEEMLVEETFSIIENWEIPERWTPDGLLPEYKKKRVQTTLEGFGC